MSMTIAEKILADHSGKCEVSPGEIVNAAVDRVMVHEMLGMRGGVAELFEKFGLDKVWDPERIVALLDHWVPAPSIEIAEQHKICRDFVKKFGIRNWYDMREGICHQIMPEKGHVCPGELILGTDSHTTTYGAFGAFGTGVGTTDMAIVFATGKLWLKVPESMRCIISGKIPSMIMGKDIILHTLKEIGAGGASYRCLEYYGDAISQLSIDGRMTVSNMAVEADAKAAIIPPDKKTIEYVKSRTSRAFKTVEADQDAVYVEEVSLNVSDLEPQVAKPPSPSNSFPITEVEEIPIDEAFIGSCTNGRLEDLRIAAKILKNKKVEESIRLIVIPASYEIFKQALREGIVETVLEAGGIVESPTCGPCIGGHLGVLASNETAITTSNRNFVGRMGSPKAKVYLASPATVAASAVKGRITDPRSLK